MVKSRSERQRAETVGLPGGRPTVLQWAGLRARSTWALAGLLLSVLVTGLSVVKVTHQNRFAFNELQERKEEAVDLDVMWSQLLIEQSTFGLEGRIEQKAREELAMRIPELSDIVMVRHD